MNYCFLYLIGKCESYTNIIMFNNGCIDSLMYKLKIINRLIENFFSRSFLHKQCMYFSWKSSENKRFDSRESAFLARFPFL